MATFLNETFTDSDGAVLPSGHVGETGATWTRQSGYTIGVHTVGTNRVYCTTATSIMQASGTPAGADYSVTATLRVVSAANEQNNGVIGRAAAAAATFYYAVMRRVSSGGGTWSIQLGKYVNNTATALGSQTISAPSNGTDHTIELRMVGDQISAYYDGSLSVGPVTDSAITAAGNAGIFADTVATTSTGRHIADVTAVDLVPGKQTMVGQAVKRASYY